MATYEVHVPTGALQIKCQHADCTVIASPFVTEETINPPQTYGREYPWRTFQLEGREFLFCGKHAEELQRQLNDIKSKVR